MSANRKNLLAGENIFQKVKSFLALESTIYAYFLNFGALRLHRPRPPQELHSLRAGHLPRQAHCRWYTRLGKRCGGAEKADSDSKSANS